MKKRKVERRVQKRKSLIIITITIIKIDVHTIQKEEVLGLIQDIEEEMNQDHQKEVHHRDIVIINSKNIY